MIFPIRRVFTMEIDGQPTVAFEAKNTQEALELCRESWFRDDLSCLSSNGVPLLKPEAKLTVRVANEAEAQTYRDADKTVQASDELVLAYLVDLDGPGLSE
jgi:hypothetical protein